MFQLTKSEVNLIFNKNLIVSLICDEEYPRRVAIDLIYKILENFNQHVYTNKINVQNINKDSDLKFKYISTVISEWQNPNQSEI
jgi:hypothetical protein